MIKCFFHIFFLYIKILAGYYKKKTKKWVVKKQKNKNMVVNYIEIFLERKENKKCQYPREWYRNIPKDEKQRLVEYRKNYSKMQKIKTVWL